MNEHYYGKRFHCDHTFLTDPIKLKNWKLIQIGELFLEPLSEVCTHDQICHELSYVISGEGFFEHNGKKNAVKQGDIIVSPNCGNHNIIASERSGLFFAYIGFDFVSEDTSFEKLVNFYSNKEPLLKSGVNNIYSSFRHCLNEFNRENERNSLMIEARLTELIITCKRIFTDDTNHSDFWLDAKKSGKSLYKIIKYIERNVHKPITVSEIAKEVGYSPYYLSHFFKENMGITLQNYILDKRIEFAKEQMALGRFTVTEISNRLGYLNLQSFSRSFKQKTGQTPTEFMHSVINKSKNKN